MRVFITLPAIVLILACVILLSTDATALNLNKLLSHKSMRHVNRGFRGPHERRSHGDRNEENTLVRLLRAYADTCKALGRTYDARSGNCLEFIDDPSTAVGNHDNRVYKKAWGNRGNWG